MKKAICSILVLFILVLGYIVNKNIIVTAKSVDESSIGEVPTDYYGYDISNSPKFIKYLEKLNYDLYDESSQKDLLENYLFLYFDAIEQKKIQLVSNDILLGDYKYDELRTFIEEYFPSLLKDFDEVYLSISIKWHSDQTLDVENEGTHQVITKDALEVVDDYFPNFFLLNSNDVYVTQCYSDYPDIFETDPLVFNEAHFYHYDLHTNYFGNVLSSNTAKSMFLDHYNRATKMYMYNQEGAMRELGAAIHYLEDLGTPVHVGDGLNPTLVTTLLALGFSIPIIYGLYAAEMGVLHKAFEDYVDGIDNTSQMDIPTNVDFEYYVNIDLDILIDDIVDNSYEYYDEARSNDSQKYIAAENTIPYIKEVVAGILFRFAYNLNSTSQDEYDGILIRNNASNLYMTASSTTLYNGTNIFLDSFSGENTQIYIIQKYNYSDGENALNGYYAIANANNVTKRFDIVNGSGSNGTNLQIYDQASVNAQYYKSSLVDNDYGYIKIYTNASDFERVLSVDDTTPEIGSNVYQWDYVSSDYDQWYFDLLRTVNVDWASNNLQESFIHKGQYIYYKLIVPSSGNYIIETKSDYDTYFNLYTSRMVEIGSGSIYNNAGDDNNAKINTYFSLGTYYVKMRMYSSTSEGRVNFIIYKSNQSTAYNVTEPSTTNLYISSGYIRMIKFTVPSSGTYSFYTTGTYDTYLTIYNTEMIYIWCDDDSGTDYNAKVTLYLTQGTNIYLLLRFSSSGDSGTIPFTVIHNTSC